MSEWPGEMEGLSMDDVVQIKQRIAALEKQVLSILRFLNEAMTNAEAR